MKLHEIPTEKFFDIMVQLVPFVDNITKDKAVTETFIKVLGAKHANEVSIFDVFTLLPVLLPKHKADVFQIVALMTCKTVSEVAEQSVGETAKDIRSILNQDFSSFFGSSTPSEQPE